MKPNADYPRMMFRRSKDPVVIHSEEEEADLGAEWSRIIAAALPVEEKPGKAPVLDPVEDDEEPEEETGDEPEHEDPAETTDTQTAAPAKPKRGRPAARKPVAPPHKTTTGKRR